MPGTISEGPSVTMSFANNFWGKDDAGVEPLIQRMLHAKQTCDELKSFYSARSALEEDYARKLLQLSKKPLGSQETGTLRVSLDTLRGEVEAMGKAHQTIAAQMKTELEEPLAAFAGAMKERRKIVQHGTEKLLKIKVQQTQQVNKTRDKYEQECLKIKGYLAQGHMVMGQEERRNKAKLEKTQINLAASNTEYENAVKILEDTTGRWNRDWKAAADKFQDLEEERLDFLKSSLWSFANIASTVCVSDDASCEKVRLALEDCEVEKDIMSFIKERGTGQEIPDPPKYINFCRGDADSQSEASEDEAYSVAQFQRTINPAYRSSSPQPSTYESHHDPQNPIPKDLAHSEETPKSREQTTTPQRSAPTPDKSRHAQVEDYEPEPVIRASQEYPPAKSRPRAQSQASYQQGGRSRVQQQIEYQQPERRSQDYQQGDRQRQQAQMEHQQSERQRQQPPIDYQQSAKQRQQSLDYQQNERQKQTERQKQAQAQAHAQAQAQAAYRLQQQERARQPQLEYQPRPDSSRQPPLDHQPHPDSSRIPKMDWSKPIHLPYDPQQQQHQQHQQRQLALEAPAPIQDQGSSVPHDPYPMDGMTMLCRTGPPSAPSDRSSAHSPVRPSSRDSQSDYSNPTSLSSQDPSSGQASPVKQTAPAPAAAPVPDPVTAPSSPEKAVQKKKSGFFQSHSPFRRKSSKEKDVPTVAKPAPTSRNTWSARNTSSQSIPTSTVTAQSTSSRRPTSRMIQPAPQTMMITDRPSNSPEPVDPRANFQLNIGNNVFDVAAPEKKNTLGQNAATPNPEEELDPIAQALADLKGVTKASSTRVSADKYHGVATPAPGATPASRPIGTQMANGALMAGMRGTPPPSYDQTPVERLGLPSPAFTSKAMQQTRQKYIDQTQNMFSPPQPRPDSQAASYGSRPGTRGSEMPRATSPAPSRGYSPRPPTQAEVRSGPQPASPAPYAGSVRSRGGSTPQPKRNSDSYYQRNSPAATNRAVSPAPFAQLERPNSSHVPAPFAQQERPGSSHVKAPFQQQERPSSSHVKPPFTQQERPASSQSINNMAMQLAPAPDDAYGSQGRSSGRSGAGSRAMSYYGGGNDQQLTARTRSKSVADVRQFNREGRPILHFGMYSVILINDPMLTDYLARALYMYQAAIPEELSFAKGDVLAVMTHQDDGWWEAEVAGKNGRAGLVPSNYLQNC
ncbi:cell division control protein [Rutstroemia sp. NJR-2017a WRK4]|nr:cell division control protein [Rutstroemia sp. NJR-2017a WRK4]PQE14836.1 cell division control protein [Rutstroemia sp. NJR-2017a WRK4]